MWFPPFWFLQKLGEGAYKGFSGWEEPSISILARKRAEGTLGSYAEGKSWNGYGGKTSTLPAKAKADNTLLYIGIGVGIIIFIIVIIAMTGKK